MCHHWEISPYIILQRIVAKGYSKKALRPSNTTVFFTFVLGLSTSRVCLNLGIVSKKYCTFLNWSDVRLSKNVFNSSNNSDFSSLPSPFNASPSKDTSPFGSGIEAYLLLMIPNNSFDKANVYFLIHCLPAEFISKLLEDINESLIVKPPTVPDSAFNTPAFVTLNGAEPKVPWPNCIPTSPSATNISVPLPRDIDLPLASNVKFVAVKVLPSIVNPAIFPPVSKACEPVICPLDFNLRLPFELEIAFDVITNPPISPAVAVTVPLKLPDAPSKLPWKITSPSGCKWNLLELISILPSLPLTNCEPALPKKNLGVAIVTALPLINVVPVFWILIFPWEPLMKFVGLPKKNLGVANVTKLPLKVVSPSLNIFIFPCEPLI